ncbi:MAG: hypothetical protein C3F18_03125 [Nitrosomonadales bacterium]|nr:MAG: hypothetical protein C3F18_03125 [Nitrosomonadales bacterium]
MTGPLRESPSPLKKTIGLFLGLVLIVPLIALSIIQLNGPEIRKNAFDNLSTIARLKADQIEDWHAERKVELEFLASGNDFVSYVERLVLTGDAEAREVVVKRLGAYSKSKYYQSALLMNTSGQLVAAAGEYGGAIAPAMQQLLQTALKSGRVEHGDLYRDATGHIFLDYVLPLHGNEGGRALAAVLLHAPAENFLFPRIQTWPAPSSSAEILLVRRDGNDVLYLNELRHRHGTALSLRAPLDAANIPAAVAVRSGKTLVMEGLDYRGVDVFSASHPVAGTPWHLVAKIDREEVVAPLKVLIYWVSLLTLVAVVAVTTAVWWLWRQILHTQRLELAAQAAALQRESEVKYRRLHESMRDAYVMVDMSGRLIDFNPAYREMLGYSEEELRKLTYVDLTPEKWHAFEGRIIEEQIIPHGQSEVYQKECMRKDGTVFPVEMRTFLLQDANNQPEAMWSIARDITERKKIEAELDKHRHHLEKLVEERTATLQETNRQLLDTQFAMESVGIGIQWVEADTGRLIYVNRFAAELLGYAPDEMIRLSVPDFDPNYDQERFKMISEEIRQKGHFQLESVQRAKDGRIIPVELNIYYLPGQGNNQGRFISFLTDITKRKETEAALTQAKEAAEALAVVKSNFLANMSHEIRTPINAVLGFADLCLRLDLPARGRDYAGKIHTAASSLLGIINDILDFSKIEAGKLRMESISFGLGEVLHRVSSLFNLKAREKGLELAVGSMPGIPDRLVGDPLRLAQVLTNLMGNAIKFTERGAISLIVEPLALAAGSATLRFTVRDSGLGMTPEQQASLFTAFAQADSSTTRKYGGTGLGLAISKQLVERMGGEISVESEAGRGSCFSFTARFGVATGEAVQTAAQPRLVDKRVLVVDDDNIMRTLLDRLVKSFGCQAEAVSSGEAALARLQAEPDFDLILLDWRLPGLDGLTTARRIRTAGNPVPIIMITGDEAEMARVQAEENDIQAFLAKPVSPSSLRDTMDNVLSGQAEVPPSGGQPPPVPDLTGARILLVDDNDFNRQVGRELVEITGATLDTADDGAQAAAAAANGGYDLVLMDLQMPVMDGYAAARTIRERWPDLPILALTAHAMVEEKERVLAAGMNDILTKPILPDALYAMLAGWLAGSGRQGKVTPGLPISMPSPQNPPADTASLAPDSVAQDGFDLAAALARVNGNREMLERFLRLFRERNAGCVDEIGAALALQDFASARRLAHGLKGGAGTVGAVELQAAAGQLEATLAASPQGTDDQMRCTEDFTVLEGAWARALETLASLLDAPDGPHI